MTTTPQANTIIVYHILAYDKIIDLGKPSYVNGVIMKNCFGGKSIVHNTVNNDDDDNRTTKTIVLNIASNTTLNIQFP